MNRENPTLWVVAGAQWGDEGKGKTVDILAEQADVIYKANGGKNAGHSVQNGFGSFGLHLVPSGIFYPNKLNVIGNGVVYSLAAGLSEIEKLESEGVSTEGLRISSRTPLAFRFHEIEDSLQEAHRGSGRIGTTGTGNGPAYSDKADRIGIRIGMLQRPDALMQALKNVLKSKQQLYFPNQVCPPEFQADYYEDLIQNAALILAPKIIDIYEFNEKKLAENATFLIEGSHGALLDIDGGSYPYVTSSSCTVTGLISGAGLPNMRAGRAIAIFKAYQTRVGDGPMPTEIPGEESERIRRIAHEFGTTTGRPRRIGWFDSVAARHAQRMNGFTESVITRGDVLTGEDIKIAVAYLHENKIVTNFPDDIEVLAQCQPIYHEENHHWDESFKGANNWSDLPYGFQRYLVALAKLTGVKPNYIGTGPRRQDGIDMQFDLREMI